MAFEWVDFPFTKPVFNNRLVLLIMEISGFFSRVYQKEHPPWFGHVEHEDFLPISKEFSS